MLASPVPNDILCFVIYARRNVRRGCRRFTDEAAKERKKLDSEVVETEEMKAARLEKAVRQETIKEQVQVRYTEPPKSRWMIWIYFYFACCCG